MAQTERVQWYALRTRHQHEKCVSAGLRNMGYQEFLPLYAVHRRHHGSLRQSLFPLFPGYVFCQFDFGLRLPVLKIPGVVHVVNAGKEPAPVPEEEIAAVQMIVQSGLSSQPWPFLQLGHRVEIAKGPLSGAEGILVRFKSDHRLVVSVAMLQRSVAVEIEGDWVRPLAETRRLPEALWSEDAVAARRFLHHPAC
ncbi:MAG: transcription termination/antitermination protein NusG [Terriglobia bacterium]